ncbi:hypothetical protein BDY17DRAFT_311178 [Neohortaea acidophila]|uniref:SMODS and SLOG-associating 2TM effector domain-containing protein n=1 Tax=Neohortaea acidophila TaxID=245834 RepID=A0A6A6PRZ7_9PEZI|nr:uncharacterized protein BDY17DRAFT_311178 [Neohortaea acidophila]KAF2482762.1 hypothetical protein BDY17DRAFT_311178 [Neohortaea acidophila]
MDNLDIEKGLAINTTSVASGMTDLAPMSPNTNKRYSQLETFQILVGNIDKPMSPKQAQEDLYHELVAAERRSKIEYYFSGFLFFLFIFLQIFFCLTITVGAQEGLSRSTISALAAINTGVAAVIGILKGLGLPEKKGVERTKLQRVIQRIKVTTKKLKLGNEMDPNAEFEDLQKTYYDTEDAGQLDLTTISSGPSGTAKGS